jgi:RNA polymerase II subunit A small phosphatase-like protein
MQNFKDKILILDLDETLIYAAEQPLERKPDIVVDQYFVYTRPFLEDFLAFCFENFDVAVWTTATKSYAEEILKTILKESQKLRFVWTRDRCTLVFDEEVQEHFYVKRMSKLRRRGYKLESVIVVDDTPNVWKDSYGNLVRVKKFEGDLKDDELKILPIYLKTLLETTNIRKVEKRNWRLRISQK